MNARRAAEHEVQGPRGRASRRSVESGRRTSASDRRLRSRTSRTAGTAPRGDSPAPRPPRDVAVVVLHALHDHPLLHLVERHACRRRAAHVARLRAAPASRTAKKSSTSSSRPPRISTARSMVCRSWRMLPGQFCVCSHSMRRGAEIARRRADRPRPHSLQEVAGQQRDVVAPLAQRRQVECDQVEPVEQVLAELAALTISCERAVRRRDHAHVDGARAGSSRAPRTCGPAARAAASPATPDRARRSRRGRSCRRRRARSGPCRSCARVGERAAHVAEHLALEQRRRDAAEVHFHERAAAAAAVAMDGLGDQLLARAALAGDQHRRVGRRDPADQLAGCAAAAGRCR